MANWLLFDKLRGWESPLPLFQYDGVPDTDIAKALSDLGSLSRVDVHIDWEEDVWLARATHVPEHLKHAYRVAALVHHLRSGALLCNPIELDTFAMHTCGCGVTNGHHRIRALQFLGVPFGPFSLSGYLKPLEDLVQHAGIAAPLDSSTYFHPRLLLSSPDDV